VSQAVYAAIDGQLCAVYAMSYAKMRSAAAGLVTLCGYRKLSAMITGSSFMMDEKFIFERFGVRAKRLRMTTREEQSAMEEKKPEETPAPEKDDEEESKRDDREEDADDERIAPERDGGLIGLVIALVVAVTGVTGGALAWLKKKK